MKIVKKNKTYFLNPRNKKEKRLINSFLFKNLKISKINRDVFVCSVFSEKDKKTKKYEDKKTKKYEDKKTKKYKQNTNKQKIKQKIVNLLNDKDLDIKHKVEGKFEYLLSKEDQDVFKEMLDKEEVFLFKLSDKYKKAIYKVNFDKFNNKNYNNSKYSGKNYKKGNISKEEFSNTKTYFKEFKDKGYIVLKNSAAAKKFSEDFKDKIKSKKVLGLKSFDSTYNIISSDLYKKIKKKILDIDKLKNKRFTIDDVKKNLKVDKGLIKIVLEFLKEDCIIIEPKKKVYSFV